MLKLAVPQCLELESTTMVPNKHFFSQKNMPQRDLREQTQGYFYSYLKGMHVRVTCLGNFFFCLFGIFPSPSNHKSPLKKQNYQY